MNKENGIIYLYGFSLRQYDKAESILKIFKEHIRQNMRINLILLHDGVIGVNQKSKIPPVLEELLKMPINIYVLISDILARGMNLKDLRDNLKAIDYEDLVEILVNYKKIISWL